MIRYDPFYKRHGVYLREELTSPHTAPTAGVELPVGPVIHFLPDDPRQFGPDETYWLLRNAPGQIWVDHVTQLSMEHGKPRQKPGSVNDAVRVWHRRHPLMLRTLNIKAAVATAQSTLVVNYGPLALRYTYPNGQFSEYHRSMNTRDTLWREITARLESIPDRHHWVPISVPSQYPNLRQIQRAEEEMDRDSIRRFTQLSSLLFLDVWKWIGDHRDKSIIAAIPEESLNRLNLVFLLRDRWFVMNLGHINAFRKQALPNEEVFRTLSKEAQKSAEQLAKAPYEPLIMQKRFLRGMMALVEAGMVVETEPDQVGPDVKKPEGQDQSNLDPESRQEETSIDFSHLSEKRPDLSLPATALNDLNRDSYTAVTALPDFADISDKPLQNPIVKGQQQKLKQSLGEVSSEIRATPIEISDEQLDKDLDSLVEVSALQNETDYQTVINPNTDPMTHGILSRAEALVKDEVISGPQYKALQKLATAYKEIKNPYGEGLLHEAAVVKPEELVVKPVQLTAKGQIFDESLLHTTLNTLTAQYVQQTLRKDVVNAVLSAQRAGVAVTDYRVVTKRSKVDHKEIHSVRLHPVGGVPTTWNFVVPVVGEDGTFQSANTQYRAKWQRRDVPIRKNGARKVSLTSYYGKVSVTLSARQVNNYSKWLADGIAGLAVDGADARVKDVQLANVFYANTVAPKVYTMLSRRIKTMSLVAGSVEMNLHFDYVDRQKLFNPAELTKLEAGGGVVAGLCSDGRAVVIAADGNFTAVSKTGQVQDFGAIEDILTINRNKAPIEIAMVKLMGEEIPVGVALAYYYGLTNMLRYLQINVRRVLAGDQMRLEPHELPIRFADEALIIDTRNPTASMILGGFRHYKDHIRQTSVYAFDRKSAYVGLLDGSSRSAKYTTELDLIDELFVDPITEGMLTEMHEPTTWKGLLLRSVELLKTDYSPSEVDGALMVYKGYERLSGTIYREMVIGVRKFRHANRISKSGIDIHPNKVWNEFTKDASIGQVNDVTPINELREIEGVTYIGSGGRSKRSMVASTRRFHVNDNGTIGEQTVDSGDVGINIYLTANPSIINTRGVTKRVIPSEAGISSMVSTSALLSPAADRDDPKRVNFIGIQHHSGIGAEGYNYMPYRTGYESVIAHRTGKKFSYVATGEGTVIGLRNDVLRIKYVSGEEVGVEVGRVFTSGAGHKYPNTLVPTVKAGDTFVQGDVLVYNSVFFKPDVLEPRQVIYKAGVPVRVALMEAPGTLEDSSIINEDVSKLMTSYESQTRSIVLDFKTVIHNLVTEGQHVEADSILCTLEDSSSEAAELFNGAAVDNLALLANAAPKAKVAGVVERIEVMYNGDVEDLSPSLAKIVEQCDRITARKARDLGHDVEDNRVSDGMRVDNNPLPVGSLVIEITITHGRAAFAGDKGVFGNQMKSVFGRVMTGENMTASGLKLGAIFSDKSIEDRVVLSARIMGMANALCFKITDNVIAAYRGK